MLFQVPQQSHSFDCGLFMLHYMEMLIKGYRQPGVMRVRTYNEAYYIMYTKKFTSSNKPNESGKFMYKSHKELFLLSSSVIYKREEL